DKVMCQVRVPRIAFWSTVIIVVTMSWGCSKTEAPATGTTTKDEPAVGVNQQTAAAKVVPWPNDAWHQSFEQATRAEPPQDAFRPVDMTKAGKNVGKMYEQIAGDGGFWKQILFVDADGKTVHYTVTLKTDLGDIV